MFVDGSSTLSTADIDVVAVEEISRAIRLILFRASIHGRFSETVVAAISMDLSLNPIRVELMIVESGIESPMNLAAAQN
jgi:hypothetical protein